MIDLRHSLAVLATRMPWAEIESALASCFACKDYQGRVLEGLDLFGPTLQVAGVGKSAAGRLFSSKPSGRATRAWFRSGRRILIGSSFAAVSTSRPGCPATRAA